jgi:hypothetical protein
MGREGWEKLKNMHLLCHQSDSIADAQTHPNMTKGGGVAGKLGARITMKLTLSFLGRLTLLFLLWKVMISIGATWMQEIGRTLQPNHTLLNIKKELPQGVLDVLVGAP